MDEGELPSIMFEAGSFFTKGKEKPTKQLHTRPQKMLRDALKEQKTPPLPEPTSKFSKAVKELSEQGLGLLYILMVASVIIYGIFRMFS